MRVATGALVLLLMAAAAPSLAGVYGYGEAFDAGFYQTVQK